MAQEYDFLNVGDTLSKEFIEALPDQNKQEIAHQLNRRTEFRVLSTDYVAKPLRDQNMDVNDQIIKMGRDELMEGKKGGIEFDKSKREEAHEDIKTVGYQHLKRMFIALSGISTVVFFQMLFAR